MIGYVFASLSMIMVVKSSAEVDWCSPSLVCRNKDQVYQHTMCIYKNQTDTPRCKNISNVQTYPGRFELLKKHNQLREFVATGQVGQWPAAAAMRKLSYDNVLEKIAYRWATQCQAGHDECRKTKRWPIVGQNVYELKRDSPIDYKMWNPASVVDDWFQAIYIANPQLGGSYSGQETSFAQMIHDKTEKIGCADVQYEVIGTEGTDEPRYRRMIVCNYGPGVEPEPSHLYQEGPTCSECPSGVRCLCRGHVSPRQARQAAGGNSSTTASSNSSTTASGNSSTTASGISSITASGISSITASGISSITASGSTKADDKGVRGGTVATSTMDSTTNKNVNRNAMDTSELIDTIVYKNTTAELPDVFSTKVVIWSGIPGKRTTLAELETAPVLHGAAPFLVSSSFPQCFMICIMFASIFQ